MTVKQKVLQLLLNADSQYFSGEQIAQELGVTRASVWKSVKALEKDGFHIDAISNKGYAILDISDVLSEVGIKKQLNYEDVFSFEIYDTVESTNKLMREKVSSTQGLVIAAKEQTSGIGRMQRHFYSPKNTGIYFSLLLKPTIEASETIFITTMAAVAVCKAIQNCTDKKPEIKWVNDIFIDGKKVCGILTQGSFSMENNKIEHVILGIGLNVYTPKIGFDESIKDIADSILNEQKYEFKNELLANILNEFWAMYENMDIEQIQKLYKSYSFVIGKNVSVHAGDNEYMAKVLDINESCNLIVQDENGEIHTLNSGEISIKL